MAARDTVVNSGAARSTSPVSATQNYSRPLTIITTLFFMWGFLTCLNDILVPHLKSIFDLSYARVMLVQFAFFRHTSYSQCPGRES
jgi:FHS family L-fucose permease-like MFS transporter